MPHDDYRRGVALLPVMLCCVCVISAVSLGLSISGLTAEQRQHPSPAPTPQPDGQRPSEVVSTIMCHQRNIPRTTVGEVAVGYFSATRVFLDGQEPFSEPVKNTQFIASLSNIDISTITSVAPVTTSLGQAYIYVTLSGNEAGTTTLTGGVVGGIAVTCRYVVFP